MNNHFPPVYRNIQSTPKHIFNITHHFEDESKLLFVFIDRKLFFIAQIRRGMMGGKEEEWVCQSGWSCTLQNPILHSWHMSWLPQPPIARPYLPVPFSLYKDELTPFPFQEGENSSAHKSGQSEQGLMQAGEKRRINFCYSARLHRKSAFCGHRSSPWLWRAGVRHKPPFCLPEWGCAGERASTAGSSPFAIWRLRGNCDSLRGGGVEGGPAESPCCCSTGSPSPAQGSGGWQWGSSGYSPWGQGGWPTEDGSYSSELKFWRRTKANTGNTSVPAACQGSGAPGSHLRSQVKSFLLA